MPPWPPFPARPQPAEQVPRQVPVLRIQRQPAHQSIWPVSVLWDHAALRASGLSPPRHPMQRHFPTPRPRAGPPPGAAPGFRQRPPHWQQRRLPPQEIEPGALCPRWVSVLPGLPCPAGQPVQAGLPVHLAVAARFARLVDYGDCRHRAGDYSDDYRHRHLQSKPYQINNFTSILNVKD